MAKTLTFRDFTWRSQHFLASKSGAAAHPHWHTYTARFWFVGAPDQDSLAGALDEIFGKLHGCALDQVVTPESTDEAVAEWLLEQAQVLGGSCVRVTLTNDSQRGAEAERERVNNSLPEPDFGTEQDWQAYRKARTR